MLNFIKNIIPRSVGLIAFAFKLVSDLLMAISFGLHKMFRTKLGLKLIELDKNMEKVKAVVKQMEQAQQKKATSAKPSAIIPQDANPRLLNIVKKGTNDPHNKD